MSDAPDLIDDLAAVVGRAHVIEPDAEAAAPYLKEWRGAFSPVARLVVLPGSTREVADVVGVAIRHDAAIVPQGGNTGTVGGSAADDAKRQILVNLSRLDAVREIDSDNATMTVEAGCTLAAAQEAAEAAGFYLPIALASRKQCRIGGNLASNAGGLNVIRYGNTRDRVLGLEVVTAEARVWDNLTGLRKDNSGYDLNDLFVGSEGTLGIITACVLALEAPARQRDVAFCSVADVAAAVRIQRAVRADTGDQITGCELMSAQALSLAVAHTPDCEWPFEPRQDWYLLIEAATAARGDWLAGIVNAALDGAQKRGDIQDLAVAETEADQAALWRLRESIPGAQSAEGASIKHDISLPVSKLPEFLAAATQDVAEVMPGVRPCAFGHVGDGNLHFNLSCPLNTSADAFWAREADLHRVVHDRVAAMRGSIAAEHGVGRLKVDELVRLKPAVEIDMLRAIKQAFDPNNRMNPGVLVRP